MECLQKSTNRLHTVTPEEPYVGINDWGSLEVALIGECGRVLNIRIAALTFKYGLLIDPGPINPDKSETDPDIRKLGLAHVNNVSFDCYHPNSTRAERPFEACTNECIGCLSKTSGLLATLIREAQCRTEKL